MLVIISLIFHPQHVSVSLPPAVDSVHHGVPEPANLSADEKESAEPRDQLAGTEHCCLSVVLQRGNVSHLICLGVVGVSEGVSDGGATFTPLLFH